MTAHSEKRRLGYLIAGSAEHLRAAFCKYKREIRVFFFVFAMFSPLFLFALPHYASDSYVILGHMSDHARAFLGSFRFFGALLIRVRALFGEPVSFPLPDAAFYVLILSLSVAALSLFLEKSCRLTGLPLRLTALFAVCTSAVNVSAGSVLCFPECIFVSGVGFFCCFSALIVFFGAKKRGWRYLLGGALLIAAVGVYQQFLSVFILYAALIVTARRLSEDETDGPAAALVSYLEAAVFVAASSALYYLLAKGAQKLSGIAPNPRASLHAASVLEGIRYYVAEQRSVLGGEGLFRTGMLRVGFYALFLFWAVSALTYLIRNRREMRGGRLVKTLLLLLAPPFAYWFAFLPGFVSDSRNVRVILAVFAAFALFGVSGAVMAGRKTAAWAFALLLCFVFVLQMGKTVEMFSDEVVTNAVEQTLARQYLQEIERYEAREGQTVERIAFHFDGHPDCNRSMHLSGGGPDALGCDWGVSGLFRFVSGGRYFQAEMLSDEAYARIFADADFKVFDPQTQMVFSGDTLYLSVY